jgi:hypothetical protein
VHPTYVHAAHIAGAHTATTSGAVAIAVMIGLAALIALIVIIIEPPNDRRDGDDSGPGGGGSGPHDGGPDTPHPAGHDPEWWPEFDRQFAEYVALHRRELCPARPERMAQPASRSDAAGRD